jgi:hypothetical protein
MSAQVETMAFLHAHGLDVEPKGLNAQLRAAIQALQASYYPEPRGEGLTAAETEVLYSGGLDPAPASFGERGDPLLAGVITYAGLLETGLTCLQAAKKLRVSDARIRQRIQERTLLAIKAGRSWRLPMFQFAGDLELPGWGEVAQSLPAGISPVAVERWLRLANPDLATDGEETPRSPRDWLLEGRPARVVAALAAGLA